MDQFFSRVKTLKRVLSWSINYQQNGDNGEKWRQLYLNNNKNMWKILKKKKITKNTYFPDCFREDTTEAF